MDCLCLNQNTLSPKGLVSYSIWYMKSYIFQERLNPLLWRNIDIGFSIIVSIKGDKLSLSVGQLIHTKLPSIQIQSQELSKYGSTLFNDPDFLKLVINYYQTKHFKLQSTRWIYSLKLNIKHSLRATFEAIGRGGKPCFLQVGLILKSFW